MFLVCQNDLKLGCICTNWCVKCVDIGVGNMIRDVLVGCKDQTANRRNFGGSEDQTPNKRSSSRSRDPTPGKKSMDGLMN